MSIKSFRDLRVWQAGLEISTRLKYLSPEQLNQTLEQTASLGRQLYTPQNALIKGANKQK